MFKAQYVYHHMELWTIFEMFVNIIISCNSFSFQLFFISHVTNLSLNNTIKASDSSQCYRCTYISILYIPIRDTKLPPYLFYLFSKGDTSLFFSSQNPVSYVMNKLIYKNCAHFPLSPFKDSNKIHGSLFKTQCALTQLVHSSTVHTEHMPIRRCKVYGVRTYECTLTETLRGAAPSSRNAQRVVHWNDSVQFIRRRIIIYSVLCYLFDVTTGEKKRPDK